MKRALAGIIAALLAATIAAAQSTGNAQVAANASQKPPSVAEGTVFNAVLTVTLDSKRLKPGDPVSARTTESVVSGGAVLLPKNTRLKGHVVFASARSSGEAKSRLAFQFDKAVLQSGAEVPLTVVLQALAPPMEIGLAQSAGEATPPVSSSGGGPVLTRTPTIIAAGGTINNQVGAAVGAANQSAAASENAASSVAKDPAPRAASSAAPGGNIPAPGQLAHSTKGVVQIRGLTLGADVSASASGEASIPAVRAEGPLVRLDSGTRLLLVVSSQAAAFSSPKS